MRLAALLLAPLLLCAAYAQQTPEHARAVVTDAVQALGGDHFIAMKDRVEEGRSYAFYNERLSGLSRAKLYIRYLTPPEPMVPNFVGLRERRAFGKKEDVYIVYNEDGGWEITYRGAKPLDQPTIDSYRDTLFHNVFYLLKVRLKEPGMSIDSGGVQLVENRPCDVVDFVDAGNRITRVWFHQSTHLPVKQSWEHRDPKTRERIEEVTVYDKFRDVGGGVMWPMVTRREKNGVRTYEMYADSVTINQDFTDALFTISGAMDVRETKSSNIRPGSARKDAKK